MHFCDFIRTARKAQFQTSKEFHKSVNLSCSYYHYSKIENGTLPDPELALSLIRALKIPLKKGLFNYMRTVLPDDESKLVFSDPEDDETPELSRKVSVEKTIVLNPAQRALLQSNPLYLEIALFLACYADLGPFSLAEIVNETKIPKKRLSVILSDLEVHGLISKDDMGSFFTKDWIYTPADPQFVDLRDATIRRALEKYLGQSPDSKWQRTITCKVSKSQKQMIEGMLESVCASIVALPGSNDQDSRAVTVGIFSSWRSFGDA